MTVNARWHQKNKKPYDADLSLDPFFNISVDEKGSRRNLARPGLGREAGCP